MPKAKKKSYLQRAKQNKMRARKRREAQKRERNMSNCINGNNSSTVEIKQEKILPQETLAEDPFVHVPHEELLQGVSKCNTDILVGDIEIPIVLVECEN